MSIATRLSKSRKKKVKARNRWFETVMAILASINLGLVLFDLSYIPWRDLYFRYIPMVVEVGDQFKGIEPHRETQKYLDTVVALKKEVAQTGLRSPQTEEILQKLGDLSVETIEENPFEVADKTGSLEKIKNQMREHMSNESAKESFKMFWSQSHLTAKGWEEEINFYDQKIKPLIENNYFRRIGETGNFIDRFFIIDFFFIAIFGLEFLARTFYLHRIHAGLGWRGAMMWRWYDILLLIPFSLLMVPAWAMLRIVPVIWRCHTADLIDLGDVQKQISQGFVANIAEDLTEVVVVRIVNQLQSSVRRGDISKILSQRKVNDYIDINNTNETSEIAKLLVQLIVYEVMPKVRPDVEALLQHGIEKIVQNSTPYKGLQVLPGVEQLQKNLTEQLVKQIYQTSSDTINQIVEEDPVFEELLERLVTNLSDTLSSQIQGKETMKKIQSLLDDLLEEVKINYVERLSEEDIEEILEQTRTIRQLTQKNPPLKPY